ncbi:hypothetical protein BT96DRAFT_911949 [Gymnopus androsaceus JB14]|uniref:Secreted protein n=1 Tax=Gymnopus androsaceus JB14 TaxID=1447944 RepID=A0A6A4IU68_9AGAR|nr:hypothetical protein BT96DRAFT_911949 [Gymnopus androsaceus JB14]
MLAVLLIWLCVCIGKSVRPVFQPTSTMVEEDPFAIFQSCVEYNPRDIHVSRMRTSLCIYLKLACMRRVTSGMHTIFLSILRHLILNYSEDY